MDLNAQKLKLAELIRFYNSKGWSFATSTNYSFKDQENNIWVSRSGIDKSEFSQNDFITVNQDATATGEFINVKPSAETLIHCELYKLFPETNVVLHSHSVYPVVVSRKTVRHLELTGYELQKGFQGCNTHEDQISIPVFENSQDMNEFVNWMKARKSELIYHCFVIRGHGTYAWGKNLFEAKRHLESLEYLCHCLHLEQLSR